ncbi:MAG: acyl-CoA dehydratase activase-related protein [Dethiobacteria bacterium]|nr:acyl-CoA dehydratase activase-related protein [Bacillota bacterium]HOB29718.1 acyl-CoA dehydratase activase-related protein [Bacillota bacterium]HPZ42331.1 acyl-CoA dehydratase activase-related protein [Bacillota bacterium]HQD53216.1 acyl-CoA dehydratase activase-related protein [Bacillota bacterium]
MIVGIPQTLSFYSYYPLWKTFLEGLGVEVVLSRPTNREILEWGIRDTVTDACIPIKILHGHVIDLKDRVDRLFIPRMVSVDGRATFCPKFLGLPDMVRFSGAKLPPVIDSRVQATRFRSGIIPFFRDIVRQLQVKPKFNWLVSAYQACQQQRNYQQLLLTGLPPLQAMRYLETDPQVRADAAGLAEPAGGNPGSKLKVALLGYPYVLYDPFISSNLYQRLKDMGVDLVTPEQVPPRQMRRLSRVLPQNFFWHYSNRVSWSSLYYLEKPGRVDGVIHVTAFACGPDAMVDKFVELEAKKKKVPFLTLTMDEHTGEGGIQTRLEAFVDMLRTKKEREEKGAG